MKLYTINQFQKFLEKQPSLQDAIVNLSEEDLDSIPEERGDSIRECYSIKHHCVECNDRDFLGLEDNLCTKCYESTLLIETV